MSDQTLRSAGPLLAHLLAAQRVEERAVGYPQLRELAEQIIGRARQIPDCLIWPVGAAAERIAGAVTIRARGDIEVGAWNTEVRDRDVLLIAVAGVSPLSLEAAAAQLRRRGAREVHGCGVAVDGAEAVSILDSYRQIIPGASSALSISLAGAA